MTNEERWRDWNKRLEACCKAFRGNGLVALAFVRHGQVDWVEGQVGLVALGYVQLEYRFREVRRLMHFEPSESLLHRFERVEPATWLQHAVMLFWSLQLHEDVRMPGWNRSEKVARRAVIE